MPDTIENAKDLETLGKVVSELAKKSTDTYTTASVGIWKMLAGDENVGRGEAHEERDEDLGPGGGRRHQRGDDAPEAGHARRQRTRAGAVTQGAPPPQDLAAATFRGWGELTMAWVSAAGRWWNTILEWAYDECAYTGVNQTAA